MSKEPESKPTAVTPAPVAPKPAPSPELQYLTDAVIFLLKRERPKHLNISLVGNEIDGHLMALDPKLRGAVIAARKADIDGRRSALAAQAKRLQEESDLIASLDNETSLLLTDGGTKPPLDV